MLPFRPGPPRWSWESVEQLVPSTDEIGTADRPLSAAPGRGISAPCRGTYPCRGSGHPSQAEGHIWATLLTDRPFIRPIVLADERGDACGRRRSRDLGLGPGGRRSYSASARDLQRLQCEGRQRFLQSTAPRAGPSSTWSSACTTMRHEGRLDGTSRPRVHHRGRRATDLLRSRRSDVHRSDAPRRGGLR